MTWEKQNVENFFLYILDDKISCFLIQVDNFEGFNQRQDFRIGAHFENPVLVVIMLVVYFFCWNYLQTGNNMFKLFYSSAGTIYKQINSTTTCLNCSTYNLAYSYGEEQN